MASADHLPGEVGIVPFPYTDLSSARERPALVLSDAEASGAGRDIVLCAMTSNLADSANSVLIADDDPESERIARPSRVKVAKVATVSRRFLRARVVRMKPAPFSRVTRKFEAVFTNGRRGRGLMVK